MSLFVLLLAVRVRGLTGSGTGGVGDDLFLCLGGFWRWLPPAPIFRASRRHNHRTWRRWQACTGRPAPRTLPPHAEGGGHRFFFAFGASSLLLETQIIELQLPVNPLHHTGPVLHLHLSLVQINKKAVVLHGVRLSSLSHLHGGIHAVVDEVLPQEQGRFLAQRDHASV